MRPTRHDPQLDLIEERGIEQEVAYLTRERPGRRVADLSGPQGISRDALSEACAGTQAAMRDGADIIYQGALFNGRWLGRPDFLVRVERPSQLGPWSYEVADAKLARHVKSAAVLQCCVYSDLLSHTQGLEPVAFHIVTGDTLVHRHRLAEYSAYFRHVRRKFEERMAAEKKPSTYPDPVEHCRVCRWYGECAERRRADDHLSRVAGMTRSYTKALVSGGLPTLTSLAGSPARCAIADIPRSSLERLREQARLQLEQYADGKVRYQLVRPDPTQPGRGLERLPPRSPLDVFLDFESHPWAGEVGIDYLMGTVVEEAEKPVYVARWAHTADDEKREFERLVDLIAERRKLDPRMHVYHYGVYERTALRRLMGRYASREQEVDGLLRAETLVDLFEIVRQGVRVSQESYSLKKVEKLYLPERQGPHTRPGFAVVEYERWMRSGDNAILRDIEAYNRDDCVSVWMLRRWLEARRLEAETQFGGALRRPMPKPPVAGEPGSEVVEETRQRFDALTRDVPAALADRTTAQQARWLLATLLDWHRREQKPDWWLYFDLRGASAEELAERPEALAGLSYVGIAGREARSLIHRYRHDPRQVHGFREGDRPLDPATDLSAGLVVAVNPRDGSIDLKRAASSTVPHPRALIPEKPFRVIAHRAALARVADAVIAQGIEEPGLYLCVRDLLLRRLPRVRGHEPGRALAIDGESGLDACRRVVKGLEDSYLAVQGPPGSGKTYTGARMIVDVVRDGRLVGITATAHKAITNMVDAVCDAAQEAGVGVSIVEKAEPGFGPVRPEVTIVDENREVVASLQQGSCQVVAGTSWLFTDEGMDGRLDVLFIDEAGQVSLANAVAMGTSARSLVLLGDPNQLPQVTKGTHPQGADCSVLEHVLGDAETIEPERGLFLAETRRLHPDICSYVSNAFYLGRLVSNPSTQRQLVGPGPMIQGTGLRLRPVVHHGNGVRSSEEADVIAEIAAELLGRSWTNIEGVSSPLGLADILIVAPYNAQVGEISRQIQRRVGQIPRVGTVDKFQGQEGAVVLFSMASSSAEDAPRSADFLYSRHRLNVAISRARAVAVIVCSPLLFELACRTPEQMRLANAFCLFLEGATAQAPIDQPPKEPTPESRQHRPSGSARQTRCRGGDAA